MKRALVRWLRRRLGRWHWHELDGRAVGHRHVYLVRHPVEFDAAHPEWRS